MFELTAKPLVFMGEAVSAAFSAALAPLFLWVKTVPITPLLAPLLAPFGDAASGSFDAADDDCSAASARQLSSPSVAGGGLQPIALMMLGCLSDITTQHHA